jgi:hypothetical protein
MVVFCFSFFKKNKVKKMNEKKGKRDTGEWGGSHKFVVVGLFF